MCEEIKMKGFGKDSRSQQVNQVISEYRWKVWKG